MVHGDRLSVLGSGRGCGWMFHWDRHRHSSYIVTRWTCETCARAVIPVEGVTALYQMGYWWCARCADVRYVSGEPEVQFPSVGQLVPDSILRGRR